jgi:adenine-specific DNA-methyltransferase
MDYTRLTREQLIAHLEERDDSERGGIRLTYKGQTPPWRIARRVRPRRQKIEAELCVGDEIDQDCNLIVEGENLQAMVSLYKYRGQVDFVLTDPPYNTGRDFRYNDKWDEDPNDPDLGKLVADEDGSKHSKWLRFMEPRIWMMREMLRPSGVLAICIDQRELFRLGLLLDGIFGEENRLAVLNWQKSYSPRNDRGHVSTATEYVLVYAKNEPQSQTNPLPRTDEMNARYRSPDGDPRLWKPGDLTAPGSTTHKGMIYAVQSPFTGELHYPTPGRHWSSERKNIKSWLAAWGSKYVERDLNDGNPPALVIKDAPLPGEAKFSPDNKVLAAAHAEAERIRDKGCWPAAHWRDGGQGTFGMKKYLEDVRQGKVPTTFWADDDYETPLALGSTSWTHKESGHSQIGIRELDSLVGRGHGFETVKPLKLFTKLIQIWCPPNGLVLDPFAGSGTAAHAVLALNRDSGASRRFVLVEQGRPNKRDDYARTLTALRVSRAISGERVGKDGTIKVAADPLPGGYRFSRLSHLVDSDAVLALEREEMIDLLVTSHWDQGDRSSFLRRLPAATERHLFGVDGSRRGYFLVWEGPGGPNRLNRGVFKEIVAEAKQHDLKPPYHVYARLNSYDGPNVEFYQIPDRILEKLGVNTTVEPFGADIQSGELPREQYSAS